MELTSWRDGNGVLVDIGQGSDVWAGLGLLSAGSDLHESFLPIRSPPVGVLCWLHSNKILEVIQVHAPTSSIGEDGVEEFVTNFACSGKVERTLAGIELASGTTGMIKW